MPSYRYAAINDMGRMRSWRGRWPITSLTWKRGSNRSGSTWSLPRKPKPKKQQRGKVSIKHLIVMCMHMEQLDRAGVPLHDALADVRDSSDSAKLRDVLTGVYEAIKNGSMLSAALAAYPRVFNDVFVGLIASGEKTGNLADSFMHLNEHLKWTAEIRRKIKKATRYPIVLLCVIIAVVTIMMTQVVPKLVEFITSQGFDLPWHTRALIATSHAFVDYWYLIFGLPVALLIGLIIAYRTFRFCLQNGCGHSQNAADRPRYPQDRHGAFYALLRRYVQ